MDNPYGSPNIPAHLRNQITRLIEAAKDAAFTGAYSPSNYDTILDNLQYCRYSLEAAILAELKKERNSA